MAKPVVDGFEQRFEGKVTVLRANLRDLRPLADRYGVESTPSFVAFDGDGEVVATWNGPRGVPLDEFRTALGV